MKTITRNETAAFLRAHDNYAILTHRNPDGDTLGSAAALCRILRSLGKTAHIVENPEITPRFAWLHEGLTIPAAEEGQCIISVDVAAPRMLPEAFAPYQERIALRIDHHGSATSFTPLELVDSTAAACAEIIYDLAVLLGAQLEEAAADALYVGISTDTGCFRFANTDSHTFTAAAACAAKSSHIFTLNQQLFDTNSLEKLQLQSWIVEHMEIFGKGDLAIVAIPAAVERAIGVNEDDTNNISSFLRSIAGIAMAATLREEKNGDVKISIRAVPGRDASLVAAKFGGGGHKGAAGCTLSVPMDEALKAVREAMLREDP